ncbi:MAG: hypothetical protein IJI05_04550 [Erysipelotrichaceae bacterium]|nr:hypothetical protein [Erysipelotrichaceae bacterium]
MIKRLFLAFISMLLLLGTVSGSFSVFAEETVYEEAKDGTINDDDVNVRSGPGTEYDRTRVNDQWLYLNSGDKVKILGEDKDKNGDVWYKVRFNYKGEEYTKWVYGEFVTISSGENTQPVTPPASTEPREATVIDHDVRVRTGPGTHYAQFTINGVAQYFNFLETLLVLEEVPDRDGDIWYKVQFKRNGTTYTQYIYSKYAQIKMVIEDDSDFEDYLNRQGFPNSYKDQLRQLHALHPSWKFIGFNTGYDWATVVNYESRLGYSLIQSTNPVYLNVSAGSYDIYTKTFKVFDGSSWYAANKQTVGYYIDPRNFLNEVNIFMFLTLSFRETESVAAVQRLLNGTFMKGTAPGTGKTYAQIFYEAGRQSHASAIYLASLARQEQGVNGSRAITGESFTYNGKTYSGLYNFYNIGATSGPDNWKKGLIYANGGERGTTLRTSYNRPWNSIEKAIVGGALWIADGYIDVGQDTVYFMKFNVTKYSTFGHQYMTNVQAAYSQSSSMYNTYYGSGGMDQELVFTIPIYTNLPVRTELPTTYVLPTTPEEQAALGNANPIIEPDPEPEPVEYTGDFIVDLDLTASEGYLYGFEPETKYSELQSKFRTVSPEATMVVKGSNGQEISSGSFISTGNIIEVTDDEGTSTYTIIIKGDIDFDGSITLVDLLMVKKDILDMAKLEGLARKAAMIGKETDITLNTYLAIKKHLLGMEKIKQ